MCDEAIVGGAMPRTVPTSRCDFVSAPDSDQSRRRGEKEHKPGENVPSSETPSQQVQNSFPGSLFSAQPFKSFQSSFPNCVPGNTRLAHWGLQEEGAWWVQRPCGMLGEAMGLFMEILLRALHVLV